MHKEYIRLVTNLIIFLVIVFSCCTVAFEKLPNCLLVHQNCSKLVMCKYTHLRWKASIFSLNSIIVCKSFSAGSYLVGCRYPVMQFLLESTKTKKISKHKPWFFLMKLGAGRFQTEKYGYRLKNRTETKLNFG